MSVYREQAPRMLVFESIEKAMERSRCLMFRPFDISVWWSAGVMVFLEGLLYSQGAGTTYRSTFPSAERGGVPDPSQAIRSASEWLTANIVLFVAVIVTLVVVGSALYVLVAWLGSHGQTMLVHAVSTGRFRIAEGWRATDRIANSLFRFRLVVGLLSLAITVGLVLVGSIMAVGLANQGAVGLMAFAIGLLPVLLSLLTLGILYALLNTLLHCFVAPLMVRFDLRVGDGWRLFRSMARGQVAPIVGLLFVRFLYYIPFAIVSSVVTCLTCCIGAIPIVHQTLFAPFYVFDRAFSMHAIESLGPDFRMMDSVHASVAEGYRPAPLMDEFDNRHQ